MTAKPAQALRQYAAFLAFEPDGSFWFANGPGAYQHAWKGVGRFDIATGKITILEAPIEGPIAIVGERLLGVTDRTPVLIDRVGKVKTRFVLADPSFDTMDTIVAVTASRDGSWIAVLGSYGKLFIFDARTGKRVGKMIASRAVMFEADNRLVFVEEDAYLVRRVLGTRTKDVRTKLSADSEGLRGVIERRGHRLLTANGALVDEAKRTYRDLSVDQKVGFLCAWGAGPDEVVRTDRRGIVETVTVTGTSVRTFARPHRNDVLDGNTVAGWFVVTTGTFIERYDLASELPTKRAARKAPSPAQRPPMVRHDHVMGRELMAAYWNNPDDKTALRVWADLLSEEGDPRGEFIQLSLVDRMSPDQVRRYDVLRKKKGEMAGPARDFLRRWVFHEGLVIRATCEAKQLVAGFEHIRWLNPRLQLTVNAVKKSLIPALAKLELGSIFALHIEGDILDDRLLAQLAPALAGVSELALPSPRLTEACIPALAAVKGLVDLELDEDLVTRARARIVEALPSLEGLNGKSTRPGERRPPRIHYV